MKHWEKVINYKWAARSSHMFLPYLNVQDAILNQESKKLEGLRQYVISSTVAGKAKFIASFNRGGKGIRFVSQKMEDEFLEFLAKLHPETGEGEANIAVAGFKRFREQLTYALRLFGEMLEIGWNTTEEKARVALTDSFPEEVTKKEARPFFTAILEYLETITPPGSATASCEPDRNAMVTLLEWAKNLEISTARNLAVIVGESLEIVAPQLRSETSGITPIKINFPDLEDREYVVAFERQERNPVEGDLPTSELARISAGLSVRSLTNSMREVHAKKVPVTADLVFALKKKFISEQSGGLLEIIQPAWGCEAIGGLEEHKRYIRAKVADMKSGRILAVPPGILLMGCPGVGKTVLAEAFAYEANIPFVKMKNTRDKYVGSSERNQAFSFELIAALAPVIVFVDEVDQEYHSRDSMADNTGVNNHLQAEQFRFMSDDRHRGKIIWFAATNRPDLMDPAMLRRFSTRMPFFPPNHEERAKILPALITKMEIRAKIAKVEFRSEISKEFCDDFGWLAHRHLKQSDGAHLEECDPDRHQRGKEASDEFPLTGGQIELLVEDAFELAQDEGKPLTEAHLRRALALWSPPREFMQYGRMTDLAIQYCNSERFIPPGRWAARAKSLRAQAEPSGRFDGNVRLG